MDLNHLAVVKPLTVQAVRHKLAMPKHLRLKQLKLRAARRRATNPYAISRDGYPMTHHMSA